MSDLNVESQVSEARPGAPILRSLSGFPGHGHCPRGGRTAARVLFPGVATEYKGDVDLVTVADRRRKS